MVTSFSQKQKAVLRWWTEASPYRDYDAIICDGAVRSGKTLSMGLSFFVWAMLGFDKSAFALCGKTLGCIRRNLLTPLLPTLKALAFLSTWPFPKMS
ncbi:MAG: hypothetical protein ACOX85_00750 [Candidatus Pararuminococcus gallinarum]